MCRKMAVIIFEIYVIKQTFWYITITIVLKFIKQDEQLENLTIFLNYAHHSKVISCPVINLRCYGNSFGGSLQLTYIYRTLQEYLPYKRP